MGTQNKEIKIALDIQAKIDKASSQIGALKKQIDNFELSKGLASDFAKEFKNIEHELAELQRKTASGEINLIDAKSAEKEIDKIEKRWAFLLSKIGGDGFLEKGLKTDAQAMAALESLAKSYANGIKEAEAQEAKLNKKLDEAKQKQKELAETQKEQKVVKASELEDQKAQLAILEKQEKAAKKTRDEAEKALRAKVEESGGKYSMDEISRKGSNLRKTDAYKTFRDAQSAYDSAKASTKAQKTNVGSMVTKEMQVAEAKAAQEAIDKATEALDNYRKTSLATAKEDAFEKAKESLKAIAEFKDIDWEGLDINMSEIKSVEDLEKALAKLRVEADKRANDAIKEMETSTKDAGQGFKGLEEDIKNAKDGLERMDEQARQTEAFEARIKQFLGMAGAVELLRRALRQAFETTKELDAAMTEMAVVTDLEVGDYWKQLPDHTKRASELGVAIHSVYEAETLYYQQGLKTAEAQELANTTLRMARIAGLDAAEATDKMTAALRGFNMELNEASAEKVADVYSELAAITAADVNEISSAMTKTASIASSAGMEFETTAAFLSQIIETTRESAETAGTAMKTVIARFSEVKKLQGEGLLTGSDEEGEVIDVNKIQTALRSVGISMDDFFAGTEGLDSIFLKLAEKWDTLDVKTQRYIATTAAGSRQQSRFIAMMSDYARTQELVTAANNSAGASQKQYEKTLESLESKLAQLKNAWDEFSMGILQSDLVKFGVDALKTFLEIINKATSAFDGLGGSITKVLTTIALFKLGQKVFDKIKQPLSNFFTGIVKDAYTYGMEAGKSFAQGTADAKKTEEQKKIAEEEAKKAKRKEYLDVEEPQSFGQKVLDKTGLQKLGTTPIFAKNNPEEKAKFDNLKSMKEAGGGRKQREQKYLEAKQKFEDVDKRQKAGEVIDQKEIDDATQSLIDAEDALVQYRDTEAEVQKASQEGWNKMGEGMKQLGGTIAGVGVGFSMLGGIISELGFEEVGETISGVGNALMIAGSAITLLGTITPVVAKIMAAAGFTVQAAWWPLLVALLAIAAAVAIVVGVIAAIKAHNAKKLENRMAAAAEATEKAREEAEAAKEAYDELLSDRSEYDEMQKNLENLTYGTKEWKEALHEVNQQVLDLITTYPELAKYMSRGEDGQLIITDEGWDALIEQQRKTVANTQNSVLSKQNNEQKLKDEEARTNFNDTLYKSNIWSDGMNEDGSYSNVYADLQSDLEDIYLIQNSSLEEQAGMVEKLADKYHTTTGEIYAVANALAANKDEIAAIADQTEDLARASLTAQASDRITNSKFGDEIIDSFAQSVGSDYEDKKIETMSSDMLTSASWFGGKLEDNKDFKRLADEYDVALGGNKKKDIKELYAAMKGIEVDDVDDSLSKEDMLKAIAEMDVGNQRNEKMEEYLTKLEDLSKQSKEDANNISGIFSDDGRGMTEEFASSLMTGMDENGKGGDINQEAMLAQAKKLGYDTVAEWAEALGKTEEELTKEAEENARKAVQTNTKTFAQLNRVLGKTDGEITKFGDNVKLTTENNAALAEKLVGATQLTGQDGGAALKEGLDGILNAAEEDADKLAGVLGSMNWNSADAWEELPELLDEMGIAIPESELKSFIEQVQKTGVAVDTVNFDTLNKELSATNELIKSIRSGEQGRIFSQENYDALVKANEDIADQFVQIGDEFHFVGTSLQNVADALQQNNVVELGKASYQLEKQLEVANSIESFEEKGGATSLSGGKLSLQDGYANWSEAEKIQYLEQFRASAKSDGVDTLKYVTNEKGESLGLSLNTNFSELNGEQLNEALKGLSLLDADTIKEEYEKTMSDQRVAQNMLLGTNQLRSEMNAARAAGEEQTADEYAKAMSIKASQTGMVAESVVTEYNDLVGQDLSKLSDADREAREKRMSELEDVMEDAIDRNTRSLEDLQTVNDQTQKVANALYNIQQKEIDELSNINDSINDANQAMVDKLQQQINENRKQKQNEKTEQAISDKQSQLAYLMADSSGAGALEAQALKEQILAEQESYQDTLIDQGLQKLSDDNAAAAEQRERQIALMEAQLEHARESGTLQREAEAIVFQSLSAINNGVNPLETQMYAILAEEEAINGGMATSYQQEQFQGEFIKDATAAANAQQRLEADIEKGTKEDTLTNLNTWLKQQLVEEEKEQKAADKQKAMDDAVSAAASIARSTEGSIAVAKTTKGYQDQKDAYIKAGGKAADFDAAVSRHGGAELDKKAFKVAESKLVEGGAAPINTADADGDAGADAGLREVAGVQYRFEITKGNSSLGHSMQTAKIPNGAIVIYQGSYYYYHAGKAYPMRKYDGWWTNKKSFEEIPSSAFTQYKTGGLADFTGPAWLDGTKSHPELVLNQRDTQNFIQLKDILADIMSDPSDSKKSSGDNYYTIDINVEELKDDYDVEQLANKIRSMLHDDAMYRNVNAISHIR